MISSARVVLPAGRPSFHGGLQRHSIGPVAAYYEQQDRRGGVSPFDTVVAEMAMERSHTDVY